MSEGRKSLPKTWQAVLVLGGFLALAFVFTRLEIAIQLALFSAWFLAIAVGKMNGLKYADMQKSIIRGITDGMEAIIILMVVGALVGTWISGGIVPSIIYYGLKVIRPSIFLVAAFILCAITSISTGTSWGTAGTAGVAMMGVGAGLGVSPGLTAGAVLSGSYFGDKLSPLSDSTILAASMSEVSVMDHVKGMLPVSIAAFIVAGIGYTIAGFFAVKGNADLNQVKIVMDGISSIFNVSILSLIPMIVIIVLLAKQAPTVPSIALGVVLGIVWGVVFQDLTLVDAVSTAWAQIPKETGLEFIDNILSRGGMVTMLESVSIIILGVGFGNLLHDVGILEVLSQKIERFITNAGNLTIVTIIVGILSNLFGGSMYVPLILVPKILGHKYDELKVSRRVLSRNTEFSGTIVAPMIPWTDNGIYMSTILGVSTLQYLPYLWLTFACIGISIFYSYTNKFMFNDESKAMES